MAGEIQINYQAAKNLYVLILNRTGQVWNGSTFESYVTANYATYPVSLVEQGTVSAIYLGTFPATITPGVYSLIGKIRQGGSPAETDPGIGNENYQWGGSATLPLAELASSGQIGQYLPSRGARGVAIPNFLFDLVSAADGYTPLVSGTVSGQIVRDNGVFGPLQSGTVTEVGNGIYRVSLTSGDLLANTALLMFTAVGASGGQAVRRRFPMILERVSGQ